MSIKVVCFKTGKKLTPRKLSKRLSTRRQVNMLTKSAPDFEQNAADFVRV